MFAADRLSLLTDLYEVTMAYAYWKQKMTEDEAVFYLFYRKPVFKGGYALFSGLESVVNYLNNWRFNDSDVFYLQTLRGVDDKPLFEEGFLDYLKTLRFSCDVMTPHEGDVVFPYEPLLRIQGPIIQCQLLESPLLALINFPSLIATKASRICLAAKGDPVIEFGLRRAQGVDGAITATRAAYIGGCDSTSNVFGGKAFSIPVKGTHAHSWVLAFDSELEAFEAYADSMPNNCIFLVDTFDTLQGIKHAIEVGKKMRDKGHEMIGVRLDSGDIAYLSIEARKLLDAAGFSKAKIFASNELDETIIASLKAQGSKVDVWGVGTHLVTGYDQPALDGVYKLSAFRKKGQEWSYKLKLSERMTKVSDPGILSVRRYYNNKGYVADALYDNAYPPAKECEIVDPLDATRCKKLAAKLSFRELLQPIFKQGICVYNLPSIHAIRTYAQKELALFDSGIKRLIHPHSYPVGLERAHYDKKISLVNAIRQGLRS